MKVKLLKKLRKKAFKKYKIQYDGDGYYILNRLRNGLYIEENYCVGKEIGLNTLSKLRRDYILESLLKYIKYHKRLINKNCELLKI